MYNLPVCYVQRNNHFIIWYELRTHKDTTRQSTRFYVTSFLPCGHHWALKDWGPITNWRGKLNKIRIPVLTFTNYYVIIYLLTFFARPYFVAAVRLETFVKTRPLAGLCVLVTLFIKDDEWSSLFTLHVGSFRLVQEICEERTLTLKLDTNTSALENELLKFWHGKVALSSHYVSLSLCSSELHYFLDLYKNTIQLSYSLFWNTGWFSR